MKRRRLLAGDSYPLSEVRLLRRVAASQQSLVSAMHARDGDQRKLRAEGARLARSLQLLRRRLAVGETRLQELSHRVKNDLQAVSALLESAPPEAQSSPAGELLRQGACWLAAIAAAHAALSQSDAGEVSLDALACQVADKAFAGQPHRLVRRLARLRAPASRATAFALVLNELLSNAVRHAFPAGRIGRVRVELSSRDSQALLRVSDDGVGLVGSAARKGSGCGLVRRLVEQELGGKVAWRGEAGLRKPARGGGGTTVEVSFPLAVRAPGSKRVRREGGR
jgi:two-component sensor histidine kinase